MKSKHGKYLYAYYLCFKSRVWTLICENRDQKVRVSTFGQNNFDLPNWELFVEPQNVANSIAILTICERAEMQLCILLGPWRVHGEIALPHKRGGLTWVVSRKEVNHGVLVCIKDAARLQTKSIRKRIRVCSKIWGVTRRLWPKAKRHRD